MAYQRRGAVLFVCLSVCHYTIPSLFILKRAAFRPGVEKRGGEERREDEVIGMQMEGFCVFNVMMAVKGLN